MLKTHEINQQLNWIEAIDPNETEQQQLKEIGISGELLFYALDENESPRIELDDDQKVLLMIVDIPTPNIDSNSNVSSPAGFIFVDEHTVVSIAHETNSFFGEKILSKTRLDFESQPKRDGIDLLLNGLYAIVNDYVMIVQKANRRRNRLENHLRARVNSQEINSLLTLETQIIYLLNSLRSNKNAIQQLDTYFSRRKHLDDDQIEHLQDIQVENQQAFDMASQANEIISSISNAYANLNNSSLDKSMRALALIQAVFAIPAVVTGFYGMNVDLPIQHESWAWIFSIGLIVLITIAELFLLYRLKFFSK